MDFIAGALAAACGLGGIYDFFSVQKL